MNCKKCHQPLELDGDHNCPAKDPVYIFPLGTATLKDLQVKLPWTIKYSTDFRSNPMSHKDFAHGLTHVGKAAGKLHEFVDNMDHDRDTALGFGGNKEQYAKYIADLVICALRMANTFPGGVIDLESEVINRIQDKNGVPLI